MPSIIGIMSRCGAQHRWHSAAPHPRMRIDEASHRRRQILGPRPDELRNWIPVLVALAKEHPRPVAVPSRRSSRLR
jgi:hypothetical protein